MKTRGPDPRKLDPRAFARLGERLDGVWPLAELPRLADALHERTGHVRWSAEGHEVKARGGAIEPWLHLQAEAELPLVCQRCLQPLAQPVQVARDFQFVADEKAAEALDADVEHDVLAWSRDLDLQALVEDELLLELPLVPRHEACPQPLLDAGSGGAAQPGVADDASADRAEAPGAHPFAALAALKNRR